MNSAFSASSAVKSWSLLENAGGVRGNEPSLPGAAYELSILHDHLPA